MSAGAIVAWAGALGVIWGLAWPPAWLWLVGLSIVLGYALDHGLDARHCATPPPPRLALFARYPIAWGLLWVLGLAGAAGWAWLILPTPLWFSGWWVVALVVLYQALIRWPYLRGFRRELKRWGTSLLLTAAPLLPVWAGDRVLVPQPIYWLGVAWMLLNCRLNLALIDAVEASPRPALSRGLILLAGIGTGALVLLGWWGLALTPAALGLVAVRAARMSPEGRRMAADLALALPALAHWLWLGLDMAA